MPDALGDDPGRVLMTPEVATCPHDTYRELRERCPVTRVDADMPVDYISRYEDVLWALRHPEVFTSAGDPMGLSEQPLIPLQLDPPEHTKYRRLLLPQFLPRAIQTLEPEIRSLVRELVDKFADRGSCDFHQELATPLPSGIFLALMGLPMTDLPMLLKWRDDTMRPDVPSGDFDAATASRRRTATAINQYLKEAIGSQRERGDGGLIAELTRARVDGRELRETEILGISHLLLLGGLDTVTATLDCIVAWLATHPDERRRLCQDPSALPAAVEEFLRSETPVMIVPRTVKSDVEIGGVHLSAGDCAFLVLGAANGDEREFASTEIDLTRAPNRHLAFGAGHHLCLGMHLARLELAVTLEEFHARVPDYRVPAGVDLRFSPGIRQPDRLPLEWQ